MRLHFTKMQGLGNDFVVFDAINQPVSLTPEQYRHIADRRFGVGCDQVLLVERPRLADTEFHYRIFNADGTEVEQCGNGARCFARFVTEKGLTNHDRIAVGTAAGRIVLQLEAEGLITVDMGVPVLEPEAIPFLAPKRAILYPLQLGQQSLQICAVSMGNPHAVLLVDMVDNVGFMQLVDSSQIRLRVYERGSGETLACGSGACAAVVAGRLLQRLDYRVRVELPGGELMVEWQGEGHTVVMSGPAEAAFEGNIEL